MTRGNTGSNLQEDTEKAVNKENKIVMTELMGLLLKP